jgi:hypothetical protein
MSLMKTVDWDINTPIPYGNNPRINKEAVKAVKASLQTFGWQQPIVVDSKGIVIVGHTRLLAAKELFKEAPNVWGKVPIHVAKTLTPEQVAAYRLADNKVGEIAEWDMTKLMDELMALAESDIDMRALGFSDADMGILEEGPSHDDMRYLEDFEVMPQPKPKFILISAMEDDCAAIQAAVKGLKLGEYRMEYSGASGSHPVHGGKKE